MTKYSRNAVLLLWIEFVLVAAPARAQAPALDADAWFERGVAFMKADDCTDAIPAFTKSNSLDSSAATLINLATCYARLGRKATAWKVYQAAATAAQNEKNDAARDRAIQAMAVLAPTLTKVQIVVPKDSQTLSLRLNGERLSDYDGLPIPLDPGESVIEAAEPGKEPWRHTVTANDVGATLVIQVPDLQAIPARLVPPAPTEPPKPVGEGPSRVPAILVGGAGVAALVVSSILGVSALSSYNASKTHCAGNRCTQLGVDERDSAQGKATASTVMFSTGLVALAASAVILLVTPSRSSAASSATSERLAWGGIDWLATVQERR